MAGINFTVWSKEAWVCLNVFKEKSRGTECNTGLIYGLASPTFDCGSYFVE